MQLRTHPDQFVDVCLDASQAAIMLDALLKAVQPLCSCTSGRVLAAASVAAPVLCAGGHYQVDTAVRGSHRHFFDHLCIVRQCNCTDRKQLSSWAA
jgi:hypothetical protein